MSFRTFSYTKKNCFDYPIWRLFVTLMFGWNEIKNLEQAQKNDLKVRFWILSLGSLAMMIGCKSYSTWNETKNLTWERIKKL